jgi:hypothetical protein
MAMALKMIASPHVLSNPSQHKQNTMPLKIIGWVLLALLTACQPAVSTPPPTPAVLQVAYTPAVKAINESLHRCAENLPLIGLVVNEVPANQVDSMPVDLIFRLGMPEKAPDYAAVISWDEVILLVHPDNAITNLPGQMVSDIYSGKITRWNEAAQEGASQPIQVWSYPLGGELSQIFQAAFLGGGPPAAPTYLAPDSAAMLEAISKNPAAVGYLLKSQLNDSVHLVSLGGETSANLRQPVLALTQAEPQGNLRQLLLCLQQP